MLSYQDSDPFGHRESFSRTRHCHHRGYSGEEISCFFLLLIQFWQLGFTSISRWITFMAIWSLNSWATASSISCMDLSPCIR